MNRSATRPIGRGDVEHRCVCGEWESACDCPAVPHAVRCRTCGVLYPLDHLEPHEARDEADAVEENGCLDCIKAGLVDDGEDEASGWADDAYTHRVEGAA